MNGLSRRLFVRGAVGLASTLQLRNSAWAMGFDPAADVCKLEAEQEVGPYYVANEMIRQDIREGKPGVPLALQLLVLDSRTCKPLPNAAIDVWHCDALGLYAGYTKSNFMGGDGPGGPGGFGGPPGGAGGPPPGFDPEHPDQHGPGGPPPGGMGGMQGPPRLTSSPFCAAFSSPTPRAESASRPSFPASIKAAPTTSTSRFASAAIPVSLMAIVPISPDTHRTSARFSSPRKSRPN